MRSCLTAGVHARAEIFFDFNDGVEYVRDEIGIGLPNLNVVEREAFSTQYDIIRAKMPVGNHVFVIEVRNEMNVCVYRGEMTIKGERF